MSEKDIAEQSMTELVEYVRQVELPAHSFAVEANVESAQIASLDRDKAQAIAVGSGVVSFMEGLESAHRQAIADSILLAQLVANKRAPNSKHVEEWYQSYFEVLNALGWVVENTGFTTHATSGQGVEAHKTILAVATGLLATAPSALTVIKATIDTLEGVGDDHSWISLFNRDQRNSSAARFQISLAQQGSDRQVALSMMAFSLEAAASVTQIAFFKIKLSSASLKSLSTGITIDPQRLTLIHPEIRNRVIHYQAEYLRMLPDITPAS